MTVLRLADSLFPGELPAAGGGDASKTGEAGEQSLGDAQGALPLHAGAQKYREELGVAQRAGPILKQAPSGAVRCREVRILERYSTLEEVPLWPIAHRRRAVSAQSTGRHRHEIDHVGTAAEKTVAWCLATTAMGPRCGDHFTGHC